MHETAPLRGDGAEELFFDDFRSGHLDLSKWNVRTTGQVVNNEQQAYIDSPETLYVCRESSKPPNHVLVLHARFRPDYRTSDGRRFHVVSGRIDTRDRFETTYGTVSARMKLPSGSGLWPAFWLMGTESWPETGEIDVMESVGESDWASSALHGPGYSGEAGLVNKHYFSHEKDATNWHVYSVDWSPESLVFKIDGDLVYRVTKPMVGFFGNWAFDNKKFLILNLAVGGVYPFKTNGFSTPYYGLSEEALNEIKAGRAKVMIDWVSVTDNGHR